MATQTQAQLEEHKYKFLTPEQVDHFLTHGYVVIKEAFTKEAAQEWTKDVWIRLGIDPEDRSTWSTEQFGERIHMPRHKTVNAKEFAPKAWGAICELLGGEEKIEPRTQYWSDEFIVNLGKDEYANLDIHPRDLENWHVDGDFFVHFLDSPEQGLLVIPLWEDIKPRGGATFIAPDGLDHVARYLAEHPEGAYPTGLSLTSADGLDDPAQKYSFLDLAKNKLSNFVELTGVTGDVILLHPLMLHSASKNYTRSRRVITNPPVSLKEDCPFRFCRDDGSEYSLVELKTLRALGVDKLDWSISGERKKIVPNRLGRQAILMELEKKRLEEYYGKASGVPPAVPPESISAIPSQA